MNGIFCIADTFFAHELCLIVFNLVPSQQPYNNTIATTWQPSWTLSQPIRIENIRYNLQSAANIITLFCYIDGFNAYLFEFMYAGILY